MFGCFYNIFTNRDHRFAMGNSYIVYYIMKTLITILTLFINTLAMSASKLDTAYFASGCFWGTEYYMMKAPGVVKTTVGYMGGHIDHPTYEQVSSKTSGHLETTEVVFDTEKTSYENLVKLFFETHDFTQTNGQGPDIGPQYRSFIFYTDDAQKAMADKYIDILMKKGYKVATNLQKASAFWKAEDYHQAYYESKGGRPYCHAYKKIF